MASHYFLRQLVSNGSIDRFDTRVLCEESVAPYDRVHLGRVLDGNALNTIELISAAWYEHHRIQLRLGEPGVALDPTGKRITTSSGEVLDYDRLVFATGAAALRPPIPGSDLDRVLTYRNASDVDRIAAKAWGANRVLVCGGGLLGLEVARTLQRRGRKVTVVETADHLLPRQLDPRSAQLVEAELRKLGLELFLRSRVSSITRYGRRLRVRIDGGALRKVDLVVLAAGIRPRDDLARAAGLECDPGGGIRVDDTLATSADGIFAIGECVRHREQLYGVVAPCQRMAEVLARRFRGEKATFEGSMPATRLKVPEVEVTAVGDTRGVEPTCRVLSWQEGPCRRRVVLDKGRVVGAAAVGKSTEVHHFQEAVARKARVYSWQVRRFERTGRLWRDGGHNPVETWPSSAIVCTCTGVTCGTLRSCSAKGARTSAELSRDTGAGSVCGTCRPLLEEMAGERTQGRRAASGGSMAAFGGAAFFFVAAAAARGPIPMSVSVAAGPSIDVLWRDSGWKQVSGFSLLGLCLLATLALSLRKRWRWISLGAYPLWRAFHAAIGVLAVLAAGAHTGFRMGDNLNFVLMACFVSLIVVGSVAGLFTSLEHRLPPSLGSALRRGWTWLHIGLFLPLPL
ncbi:MAG: FAD-dependent oxidoreductase, partial [Myxococcota bacterium]